MRSGNQQPATSQSSSISSMRLSKSSSHIININSSGICYSDGKGKKLSYSTDEQNNADQTSDFTMSETDEKNDCKGRVGAAVLKAPIVLMESICDLNETGATPNSNKGVYSNLLRVEEPVPKFPGPLDTSSSRPASFDYGFGENLKDVTVNESNFESLESKADLTRSATYFDVAVMRCLLSTKWHSEG